jgi:hypothetical protein
MADDKIRVKTNDGDVIEVERTIAKQWAPIKTLYEGRLVVLQLSA